MYFPMDLKYNPTKKDDIDLERERREEMLEEMTSSMKRTEGYEDIDEDDEEFDAVPSAELEALLPYYNQVEDEALRVAKKYFRGTFIADYIVLHNQKLFEYEHNGHVYRCYVDIYNENEEEINIIEVKATTCSKYLFKTDDRGNKKGLFFSDLAPRRRGAHYYPLFVKNGNIWHFNTTSSTVSEDAKNNFKQKKTVLLNRYGKEGKYPHDLAFQRFVIDNALRLEGDNRQVNYYLAVLNSEYVYDGTKEEKGKCIYNEIDGQEIVTFFDMNETTEAYQPMILEEVARLESYISKPHDITKTVDVGKWCAWGNNTECLFWDHCFTKLRKVPVKNSSNKYIYSSKSFFDQGIDGKYGLINRSKYTLADVPEEWLKSKSHRIQRRCYVTGEEYKDEVKLQYWLKNVVEYPIYHFDFEAFPCPLPRFHRETPYRQSVFEFSLHIERSPGVCDKVKDNFIFLNSEFDVDERKELAKAIVNHFEFNKDGTLHGTMLAQNTSYEKGRLTELAELFPQGCEYRSRLLAIRDKSADLIHLLRNNKELYKGMENADVINYYHKDLSGSYSIKKTLPVLVPSLSYDKLNVGNGVQAYIAYINYDSPDPTFGVLKNKKERRDALKTYCQQDTWAMVEILRAVRAKI